VVLWALAVLALLVALLAVTHARRLGRRLDALTQSYWELRYDYTRLRSQVARLDPEQAAEAGDTAGGSVEAGQAPPPVAFVPLSSIKRKEQ
jgi:hypothetical protein